VLTATLVCIEPADLAELALKTMGPRAMTAALRLGAWTKWDRRDPARMPKNVNWMDGWADACRYDATDHVKAQGWEQ
jgi:hypothetical protein